LLGGLYQLAEVDEKLLAKRIEMGGIYGPLEHRLKLMKRRDHLERRENVVRQHCRFVASVDY